MRYYILRSSKPNTQKISVEKSLCFNSIDEAYKYYKFLIQSNAYSESYLIADFKTFNPISKLFNKSSNILEYVCVAENGIIREDSISLNIDGFERVFGNNLSAIKEFESLVKANSPAELCVKYLDDNTICEKKISSFNIDKKFYIHKYYMHRIPVGNINRAV